MFFEKKIYRYYYYPANSIARLYAHISIDNIGVFVYVYKHGSSVLEKHARRDGLSAEMFAMKTILRNDNKPARARTDCAPPRKRKQPEKIITLLSPAHAPPSARSPVASPHHARTPPSAHGARSAATPGRPGDGLRLAGPRHAHRPTGRSPTPRPRTLASRHGVRRARARRSPSRTRLPLYMHRGPTT